MSKLLIGICRLVTCLSPTRTGSVRRFPVTLTPFTRDLSPGDERTSDTDFSSRSLNSWVNKRPTRHPLLNCREPYHSKLTRGYSPSVDRKLLQRVVSPISRRNPVILNFGLFYGEFPRYRGTTGPWVLCYSSVEGFGEKRSRSVDGGVRVLETPL